MDKCILKSIFKFIYSKKCLNVCFKCLLLFILEILCFRPIGSLAAAALEDSSVRILMPRWTMPSVMRMALVYECHSAVMWCPLTYLCNLDYLVSLWVMSCYDSLSVSNDAMFDLPMSSTKKKSYPTSDRANRAGSTQPCTPSALPRDVLRLFGEPEPG